MDACLCAAHARRQQQQCCGALGFFGSPFLPLQWRTCNLSEERAVIYRDQNLDSKAKTKTDDSSAEQCLYSIDAQTYNVESFRSLATSNRPLPTNAQNRNICKVTSIAITGVPRWCFWLVPPNNKDIDHRRYISARRARMPTPPSLSP